MGNVELFELCETIPKAQCSEFLLYWNQGMINCICGHLMKKGRPRGARHGKSEVQKEHFMAHNALKRCMKKNFEGIHDRFQRDSVYGCSQLKIGWTEEKCIEMDKLALEDHSYRLSCEEYERYQRVSHTEQIGQTCTDETPIRLPNRSHINEPSPPRISRRSS